MSKTQAMIKACDRSKEDREKTNQEIADFVKEETGKLLSAVLYEASMEMKNGYSRSDA